MAEEPALHAGDSAVQRRAEGLMLSEYQLLVPQPLVSPFIVPTPSGARMEFDAGCHPVDDLPGVLVEAWAHQGSPKAAQKKKIIGDALKLAYANTLVPGPTRLVLLFSDEEAVKPFLSPRAWSSAAFAGFGIETHVVELPPEERTLVREAQIRQYR